MPEFKRKVVGYIDILGFKSMVAKAESGETPTLDDLLRYQEKLGQTNEIAGYRQFGPTLCPCASKVQTDLDLELAQVSDGLLASAEVSPAGVINLLNHLYASVFKLAFEGVMCRGFVTIGSLYHKGTVFIGTGFQDAYFREGTVSAFKKSADDKGTPYVEIGEDVCDYVRAASDECVQSMFQRMTNTDGEVTVLFPLRRLSHDFVIGGVGANKFDPAKEKAANQSMRELILATKERLWALINIDHRPAVAKAEHYSQMLDAQLAICDRTDQHIDGLAMPWPHQTMRVWS